MENNDNNTIDSKFLRKRDLIDEINCPIIKKAKCENSSKDTTATDLKESTQNDNLNNKVNTETAIIENINNLNNTNNNINHEQNDNKINDIQNEPNDDINLKKNESQIEHTLENNNIENIDTSLQDNINKQPNNNLNEENNLNIETNPSSQELTFQFPTYEFKKETTLCSIEPIHNPRCSTQNDFLNNSPVNNYFKGAKW